MRVIYAISTSLHTPPVIEHFSGKDPLLEKFELNNSVNIEDNKLEGLETDGRMDTHRFTWPSCLNPSIQTSPAKCLIRLLTFRFSTIFKTWSKRVANRLSEVTIPPFGPREYCFITSLYLNELFNEAQFHPEGKNSLLHSPHKLLHSPHKPSVNVTMQRYSKLKTMSIEL